MSEERNLNGLEDLQNRYLLLYLGDDLYAVSLTNVIEIVSIQNITWIPHAAPYVKGIVNLRGRVYPVIDLRHKLNMPEKEYDDKTCIIMVEVQGNNVGLIVDMVSEVRMFTEDDLSAPPNAESDKSQFVAAISEIEGKHILIIDCRRLLQDDIDFYAGA